MAVHFHEEDLPPGVLAGTGAIAIDTETMGLITPRDRLCVVQLSDGSGDEHLVRFGPGSAYDAPNLKALLADNSRVKLYHYARFDLAALVDHLAHNPEDGDIVRGTGGVRSCAGARRVSASAAARG